MTTLQRSLHALFLIGSIGFFNSRTLAQDKALLPPELNQNSSLSEIVTWLDKTSFAKARVRMKDSRRTDIYQPPWVEDDTPKETLIFTQGFRLTRVEGCTLVLRNDDARIIPKSLKMEDSKNHFAAQLYVPLYRLGATKGRAPYLSTKNLEKARLLGTWRTEFKYEGLFSRKIVEMDLFSAGSKSADWRAATSRWDGENLAFTFDSKEMSEKFDAAFRQAIKLCQRK